MQRLGATSPFAVHYDTHGAAMQAFSIQAYPTAYLLDGRSGQVVWEGIPHFHPPTVEAAIRSALHTDR